MPFNIGMGELLIVLVVALLVFGGRLPEVGRSLGKGLSEFKKGLKGLKDMAGDLDEKDPEEDPEKDREEAGETAGSEDDQGKNAE